MSWDANYNSQKCYFDYFIAIFIIIWYNEKIKKYNKEIKDDLPLFKSRHKQIIKLWLLR